MLQQFLVCWAEASSPTSSLLTQPVQKQKAHFKFRLALLRRRASELDWTALMGFVGSNMLWAGALGSLRPASWL